MYKNIYSSIRQYRFSSILTSLLVALEVGLDVIVPLYMARIIDEGIIPANWPMVKSLGTQALVLVVISTVFGISSARLGAYSSTGLGANLRYDIFEKIQTFSFSNLDKFSPAGLVTRISTDTRNVVLAYMMVIRVAVRGPLLLVFSLFASFSVNPTIASIFLLMIPILTLGMYLIMTKSVGYFQKVFPIYDDLNLVLQENLGGMKVVKAFANQDLEEKKFGKISSKIYQTFLKGASYNALAMPYLQLIIFGGSLTLAWVGSQIIINTNELGLTTGELVSSFAYMGQILNAFMLTAMVLIRVNISRASAQRINEVLEEKPDIVNISSPVRTMRNSNIVFDDVSFIYQGEDKSSIWSINLQIPQGSTLGILGPTGSGKSTLVQLIPRLYDTSTGAVLIGGVNVKDYDLKVLRDSVAMVLQQNLLFSGTIAENLRWGNENASLEELQEAAKLADAHDFIESFIDGYDTYVEQGGANLSGGQKQRLTIARAILKNPKILILDDSTSAVDTKTEANIRRALRDYLPETTKIIIGQRVSSVEDSDLIIVMDDGRIVGQGSHEDLLKTNDLYKEIYKSQVKGDQENVNQ